jgi:NADH-quinone oxidoreductase subunit M
MATLLVLTVLFPLLGSLVLFLTPKLEAHAARLVGLSITLITLGLSMVLLLAFRPELSEPQFAFVRGGHYGLPWVGRPDIRFALGLDGLSLWLFLMTSLLMLTAIGASWLSVTENAAAYYAFLLALETGLLGLFASLDVVLFYIFFEFTLIPLFFLIGLWGGPQRRRAAVTFFLYTLAGSLLTLLGVIALVVVHYQYSPGNALTFSIPELTQGLAQLKWIEWYSASSWTSPQVLIFLLLLAGFAIKVPIFPFHTWLPLAHVEAPTAGSILLAGVLLKVGSYGLLRFCIGMTPLAAAAMFPQMATLAVIGIIYGALAAFAQSDIKRLVAYSSVSHMGFIVLGMFALNGTGLDGSTIQMVNHGLTTGALFACVGMIYERYHTRDITRLGGLWDRLPILAFFLILAALGSAAVPGLNGFVGEFPILVGAFAINRRAAVLAATGMILGACYLLWMVRKVIFGPLNEPVPHEGLQPDSADAPPAHVAVWPVGWHEIAGLAPLMVLIVAIGVYPRPLFEQMRPALARIEQKLQTERVEMNKLAAAADALARSEAAKIAALAKGGASKSTAKKKGGGTKSSPKKGGGTSKSTAKEGAGKGKTSPKKSPVGAKPAAAPDKDPATSPPADGAKTRAKANETTRPGAAGPDAKPERERP